MTKKYDIASKSNETFKAFKELLVSKGIVEQSRALLFGDKVVKDTLRDEASKCRGLIVPEDYDLDGDFKLAGEGHGLDSVYFLKKELFKDLDVFGTRKPILLVEPPKISEDVKKNNGCHLFVPFQDPSNVGSVIRSGAAFEVSQVILGPTAPNPFHPRSSRAASGSLFLNQYSRISDIIDLHNFNLPLVALDMDGEDISDFLFPPHFILIPGMEGPGLPSTVNPDYRITIPMNTKLESLNAMVATSIALQAWHANRKNSMIEGLDELN